MARIIPNTSNEIKVYTSLRLADFTQFNASTYISGAVSDNDGNSGWTIPLLGGSGKNVSDPFSGWHAISTTPLQDANGDNILVTDEWLVWLGLHEITTVTSTDIDIVIGVCNVSTDGATNDWVGCGFRNGATRTGLTTTGTNGVATQTAGTTLTTIRRLRFPVIKMGSVTSEVVRPVATYMGANNATVIASNGAIAAATTYQAGGSAGWADAVPYLFIAAYRTTVTDTTTRSITYRPIIVPPTTITPPI